MPVDLDQSGGVTQRSRVYLGPTIGWVDAYIKPPLPVTAAGTVTADASSAIILVNVNGLVTINLPDLTSWLNEQAQKPTTEFERAIWIKDLGGFASDANPITVVPFGTQKIDNLQQNFTIIQHRQLLRLYPLQDRTGWFSG